MQVQRLLYRSEVAIAGSAETVERSVAGIVEKASAANRAVEITGALLLSAGTFIQALEGPPAAVEATFERICCDLRHRRVRLLEIAIADERMFREWSMTRVQPVKEIARLCSRMDAMQSPRLDMSIANALVNAMRAMLLAGRVPQAGPLASQRS